MSAASTREDAATESRFERLQPWIAALISALMHLLLVLLLLFASKPTVTSPQGAAGGSRMKVDFLGEPRPAPPGPPSPPPPRARVTPPPADKPVQATLVDHSDDPVPPVGPPAPARAPSVPQPEAPESPDEAEQRRARMAASSPPVERRPQTWTGRPPGMLEEDTAPDNRGMASGPAVEAGNRNDAASAQPSMEVGGYMVLYDLRSETQLRSWQSEGMKEISIPLPGTQYYMVCPLEIALRRGSGKCRLLEPYSSELGDIGDGREVINMIQVYKQGELVWRGPGPYR
jgi:outer membrane biosynthesis protein TonB